MIEIIQLKKQDAESVPETHIQITSEEDAILNGNRPHINNIRVDTIEQMRRKEEEQPVVKPDLIAAVVGGPDDGVVGDDDDSDSDEEILDIAALRAKMKEEANFLALGRKGKVKGPAPKATSKKRTG